jgi:hypothetical protein
MIISLKAMPSSSGRASSGYERIIDRPIPHLLRYGLILKGIMDKSPPEHEDHDEIPDVVGVIKPLGKGTEPGVRSARSRLRFGDIMRI